MEDTSKQNLNQKKMELAASVHAPIIIELMRDCMDEVPALIGETQWVTTVNAIKLDVQGKMLTRMVDHLEAIRKGSLHEEPQK